MKQLEKKKRLSPQGYKKIFVFLLIAFIFSVAPLFAQGSGITTLDSWATKILGLFTSTWLKAIAAIALIIEAIMMMTAGRNDGNIIKKIAPWMIATVLLLSATGIVDFFFEGANFTFSQ